ncbi:MAG: DHH family phosphoesterase [Candidatus Cloacimonadaceae bacterium]|jgi:phosphoesterase RecJ-like protein|nr:DHH family phosphoesterase [Candidatus Cloacimonadota bacterium]MDD5624565.1 DHH family phosphoesterase [Candidatus Cloacimonadota bacterium]MDY0111645.1 DHH family phosphoesterase [Candidatus Syntrophosphaera sp.]
MKNLENIQELKEILNRFLNSSSSVAIMTHTEPDGDGFCSSLALQRLLRNQAIDSDIVIDADNQLERFKSFMEGAKLSIFESGHRYDTLIILDCNSYTLLGNRSELLRTAHNRFVVDHHIPSNKQLDSDYTFVDTSEVCTGSIIYKMFKPEMEALPKMESIAIAKNLYISLINDTNNFTNSNTNAKSLSFASELVTFGINPSDLYQAFYCNNTTNQMKYLGEILSGIELYNDGQILFLYSSLDMQHRNKLSSNAISVLRFVQGIKGVKVIAFLRQDNEESFNLSLRSETVDVNSIAVSYGGGGHKNASGATLYGELGELKSNLISKLKEALSVSQNNV